MSKAIKNALDKLTHHHSHSSTPKDHSPVGTPKHQPQQHGSGLATSGGTSTPPLVLPPIDDSSSSITGTTGSSRTSTLIPSDVDSPVHSGAATPVDERGNHVLHSHVQSGLNSSTPPSKSSGKHGKHNSKSEDDIQRTGSLNKALSQKCEDLHEHFKAIKLHHNKTAKATNTTTNDPHHPAAKGNAARPPLNHMKTEEDERALRVERHEELQRENLKREAAAKYAYDTDPLNGNYGFLNIDATPNPIDISGKKDTFLEIAKKKEGDKVYFRARIQSLRKQSAKLAFIIFRQRYQELQGVIAVKEGQVSENMVKVIEHLPAETIVLVHAVVQDPHSHGQNDIHYTSIHNVEVRIKTLHVVSQVTLPVPFDIHDASRPESDYQEEGHGRQISARMQLANRAASLRTPVNQAIFQIRAAICRYFRDYLTENGFTEIQSSKFQQGATESGASVFKVDYFKTNVSLAQSPQLAKQMCIAADFERVFEIGPVFRAENSQTARHLTEFVGMDLEMQIDVDYHEVIDMLDGMFINMFQGLQSNQKELIDIVRRQHPSEKLQIPDKTVRLTFKQAIKILNDAGYREDGEILSEYEDFSTPAEKYLGKIMKEQYHTDYYIVDKFPASVRPFYTMPDPDDPKFSNSADFFLRGQEILSGGQRIHHAPLLEKKMVEAKIDVKDMKDYLDGFRWGCPPHGGGGIGLERVLFLFLDLQNVRWASLLPRDPKSFPEDSTPHGGKSMRGPEVDLLDYDTAVRRGLNPPLPTVEDLIASYGDAANTVYLDPSWEVWRDVQTGAACGFKESEGHALAWGRPLCPDNMLKGVLDRFLHYVKKERKLKPIFACIDETTEQILASKDYDWRSLSVAAEERIDPTVHNPNSQTSKSNLAKKIKQARNAGVKAVICDGLPDEKIRKAIDIRMQDWKGTREGKQIHTTDLLPWDDPQHRRYFYAVDKQGKYVALVVLAQLAPEHGWQIKYSLSFPDGPSGAIELLLSTAIETMGEAGCHSATFGTSAANHLGKGSHQSALKMKTLSAAYDAITSSFHLLTKPEFRAKFGSEQDPVYVAYPKHGGLGVSGIQALIHALSD